MFKAIKEFFVGKPAEAVPANSNAECCGIKDCGHTQAPYKVEAPTLTEVINSQPVVKETAPVVETAPAAALPIEEPKAKPAKKPQGKKPAAGGAKKGGRKPKAKTSTAE